MHKHYEAHEYGLERPTRNGFVDLDEILALVERENLDHPMIVVLDRGFRPGPTTEEIERIKALERKNRELRQANEILRKASAYFA